MYACLGAELSGAYAGGIAAEEVKCRRFPGQNRDGWQYARDIAGEEYHAPGLAPGTPLTVPMAINFSALPARSGAAYTWRLAIDGTSEPDWRASFTVRPPKQQSA